MPAPSLLHFGPYRLDGTRGQLWHHDAVVHLRPKALAVLWDPRQVGQLVPKNLLDTVWADTVVSEGVLTACIRDLRRALGDAARQPRYIETVHRRGYRFVAEVTEFVQLSWRHLTVRRRRRCRPRRLPRRRRLRPWEPMTRQGRCSPGGRARRCPRASHGAVGPTCCPPVCTSGGDRTPASHRAQLYLWRWRALTPPLDPEDAYDLMQTLRATTLAIITAHDGQVAQHVHEGVLVYFGYPQAHEDDAQRAVRSGLALLQALGQADGWARWSPRWSGRAGRD